ncbi:putative sulfate exporter family transporter [Aeromonas media]|uniref:putative sulfate exporter family transporter n=1 Tax=Aeromonas media TaxID=651 RepID=UPI003D0194AF
MRLRLSEQHCTETGDVATVVKLMRVAMLLPVIVVAAMITRRQGADPVSGKRPPLLPLFAVGFLVLACINSTGLVPAMVQGGVNELSRWCLVIAIAAIGMKTQLKELAAVGIKPILLMVGETAFLVALVLTLMHWGIKP